VSVTIPDISFPPTAGTIGHLSDLRIGENPICGASVVTKKITSGLAHSRVVKTDE
jgi:hypothetical protein